MIKDRKLGKKVRRIDGGEKRGLVGVEENQIFNEKVSLRSKS